MFVLIGIALISMSSCATIMDNINVDCKDPVINSGRSNCFEFNVNSNCE